MPWIESHQELERHPKTLDLMTSMGWDLDITIGKLHRFWWWCVDYAEDGDLRKHNDNRLSAAVGVLPGASKQFIEAMVQSGWIDRKPYFRVHDWWHYFGEFLKAKYKNYPQRWQAIRDLYSEENKTPPKTPPKPISPNLTKPNQKDILSGKPDLVAPIEYLNQKTKKNFDPKNKGNQDLIRARYAEGRTIEQLKQVIDKKVKDWLTDEKMNRYLRPSTLFNRTNFENYLNEAFKPKYEPKSDPNCHICSGKGKIPDGPQKGAQCLCVK